jgi:hypothetical protein
MKMKRQIAKGNAALRRVAIGIAVLVTFHVSRFTLAPASAATANTGAGVATAAEAAAAPPSPEDVFRSISGDTGRGRDERGHATALLLCAAGGLILLLLLGTRRARTRAAPQPLNNSRKLMREVVKAVPLRRVELKQLRLLADASGRDPGGSGTPVQSPLTLLLCPSVLARAMQNRPAKVDRAVVARIMRKMDFASRPA